MVNVKQLIREKEAMGEELMLPAEPKNRDLSEMKTPTPTPQKDVLKREEHFKDIKEVRGQEGYRREERRLPLSSEQNRTKTLEVTRREEEIKDADDEERPTVNMEQLIRENRVMTEELLNAEKKIRELKDGMKTTEDHVQMNQMKASGDSMQKMTSELRDIKDERREDSKRWEGIQHISTDHSDYINKMRTAETKVHRMEQAVSTVVNVPELLREKEALKEQLRVAEQQNQEMRVKIKATESNVGRMEEMIKLLKEERMEERLQWEEKLQQITEEQMIYVNKMRATEAKVKRIEEEMTMVVTAKKTRIKQALAQQKCITSGMTKDTKSGTKTPEDSVPKKQEATFKDTREELSRDMGKTVEERLERISTDQDRDMDKMQTTVNQVQRIKTMFTQMNEDITEVVEERGLGLEGVKERREQIPEEYKSNMNKMNVAEGKEMKEINTVKQLVKQKEALREQLLVAEHKNTDMKNKMKTTEDSVLMMEEQIRGIKEELIKTESKVQRLERRSPIVDVTSQQRINKRRDWREWSPSPEPKHLGNIPRIQEPLTDIKERSKTPEGGKFHNPEELTPMIDVKGMIRKKEALAEPLSSPVPKSPEMRTMDYNVLRAEGKKEVPISRGEEQLAVRQIIKRNVSQRQSVKDRNVSQRQSPYLDPKSPEMKMAPYNVLRTEWKRDYNVQRTEGKKEEPMKRAESRAQESELEEEMPLINVKQIISRRELSPSPEPSMEEMKSARSMRKVEEKIKDIKESTRKSKPEEMIPTFSVRQRIRNQEAEDMEKIKEEPYKTTEGGSKVLKSEGETTPMMLARQQNRKKETLREQSPSFEQPVPSEMEETPLAVSVKQRIRNNEASRGPAPSPEPKIEETKTLEKHVQVAKPKRIVRRKEASPEPNNEDMKYDTRTTKKNVSEHGGRRGVDKRPQRFTAEHDDHPNKTKVLKAEEKTAMALGVKRLVNRTEEQEEPGEEGRTSKDERPHVIQSPHANKSPYFSVPNKTTDHRDNEATFDRNQLREKEAMTSHMLSAEQKNKAMKNELKALKDNKKREETLQLAPAEGDPRADESTATVIEMNQLIREKEAMKEQLLTAEQRKKHMKDEMKTMVHNVQKIEEKIKNMEEEQRGESPSLQLISSQRESWQLTAEHDEDINVQTHTTEDLQVEEKMQDIELENLMLYFCQLTLDPCTASKRLSLSENNRRVTNVQENQTYTYSQDRWDYWSQVMCKEALTKCCYWEVEWTLQVSIAVAYKSIVRRGYADIGLLGFNDKSWSLDCLCGEESNKYTVRHNNHKEELAVSPSGSNRVGVYLDWPAGKLSFYCVSSDRRTHLYTFQCAFTDPLYCAFWCWTIDSSVSLCQREDIQ